MNFEAIAVIHIDEYSDNLYKVTRMNVSSYHRYTQFGVDLTGTAENAFLTENQMSNKQSVDYNSKIEYSRN